ncbi:hypothetical protein K505DRAFT_350230 [Melanomma pulvis-pyrius CBS 109.77]|uniref:Lysine-specific metallo-endopeptidase domain-containing protein n=1 Tax=Melanomma pulvis-pyrius CBS 109.77 TaxID=1314802 RepID=A0A6A6XAJ3_9PLEO|nr:hypothetical protein K505DRAFT_350230 [Melanomma pulvis-pyrius CBS 109.77]
MRFSWTFQIVLSFALLVSGTVTPEFKTAPDSCNDLQKPSQQCIQDLQAHPEGAVAFSGGELKWDKDHKCDEEQMAQYQTAAWDAHVLAAFADLEPDEHNARDIALWKAWIGPDYPTQQKRIAENLKRAAEFLTKKDFDIILSCNDQKNTCSVNRDGKSVGGYVWTYKGWFRYPDIVMCEPFFSSDTLMYKIDQIEEELANGKLEKAQQAIGQKNVGMIFLHEMMHLDSVGQPHIVDEHVDPSGVGMWAYGPSLVHQLARRNLNQGGSATRASTNADSYAWFANSKYIYDLTGYFPRPPNWKGAIDSYSNGDWVREQNGWTLDFGLITETTSDDEINNRYNNIVDGMSPPPSTGKALVIAMIAAITPHVGYADINNQWHFFTTEVGHAVDCDRKSDPVHEIIPQGPSDPKLSPDVDPKNLPWPGGDFTLNINGEECHYKCDGTSAGRLFCSKTEISCKENSMKSRSNGLLHCGSFVMFHAAVWCEF